MAASVALPLETLARRMCLQNAVQHGGRCEPKGLVGRIMAGFPEHRANAAGVAAALVAAGAVVNAMAPEEQKAALSAEAPELVDAPKKERRTGLKELPNVKGKVVMRFAPNPNGPLSLGHARGVSILADYWREYGSRPEGCELILRFDDTDPQVKPPLWDEARGWNGYAMVRDDFIWLTGRRPSREVTASDRIAVYQEAARALIERSGAYVCACEAEAFLEMKKRKQPCPHRDQAVADNLAQFARMVDGTTKKGAAVLRVKTDIAHPNEALRDWTAFRVVATDAVHPREKAGQIPRHHCWPLLDFQSAIEDHLQGVTHVIRGKDLMHSTQKQGFLYRHMGWTYPETLYWGRVKLHGFGKFSTSMMRRAIERGDFSGWDDPRLPTLAALRRRGYDPGAIRAFWVSLGLTEKDIAVSMTNLDAENQKAIDDGTSRYFLVPDAYALSVTGAAGREAHIPLHPSHPERGVRRLTAHDVVYIPGNERSAPAIRLKDLGNLVLAGGTGIFSGTDLDRSMPIVQWLPKETALPFTVLRPVLDEADDEEEAMGDDGPKDAKTEIEVPPLERIEGQVEPAALREKGKVVQFERFGFVRIESDTQGVWLHG